MCLEDYHPEFHSAALLALPRGSTEKNKRVKMNWALGVAVPVCPRSNVPRFESQEPQKAKDVPS